MLRTIMLTIPLLVGCGVQDSDPDSCTVEHSTTQDLVGPQGLVLLPGEGMHLTFDQIVQVYQETEQRMGVQATGPVVQFLSFRGNFLGGGAGLYSATSARIWINTDWDRDCTDDSFTVRHEFVHHLLHMSGYPWEDNKAHKSPYFGGENGKAPHPMD